MWVQIGGCDDNNSMVFARMSPSWVTGRMVKMQIFQRGIGRRRGSWGSSQGRHSWASLVLPPRLLLDLLSDCWPPGNASEAAGRARHREKLGQTPEWQVSNGSEMVTAQGSTDPLNASHSPSLMKQLWESKALQSAPAYLTLNCMLPVLHSDSASMELDDFRALLLIFPTHLSQLLRLGADLRAWCCEWQVVHWSQWQDSRASWPAGWELRLNHNLLRLHFLSWEVWCILSFLCLRYSSSTSQK